MSRQYCARQHKFQSRVYNGAYPPAPSTVLPIIVREFANNKVDGGGVTYCNFRRVVVYELHRLDHIRLACHRYESSECAHVSIHSIAEVACYRLERTLMGCRGFHYGIRGSPSVFSSSRKTKWLGGVVTGRNR